MKREQSTPERTAPSRLRATASSTDEAWTITRKESAFPPHLAAHPRAADWPTLYGLGHHDILRRKCLGLICSVQCPGSVVIKTFDAIRELRDAGVVVAGGFHSPMEQECLEFLLRGDQPVIICPARHPGGSRVPTVWRTALAAGRLLLVSPFDSDVRRATQAQAKTRNEFVAALSAAVLIPHASPGGKAEGAARETLNHKKPLFMFNGDESADGLFRCVRQYNLTEICDAMTSDVE